MNGGGGVRDPREGVETFDQSGAKFGSGSVAFCLSCSAGLFAAEVCVPDAFIAPQGETNVAGVVRTAPAGQKLPLWVRPNS